MDPAVLTKAFSEEFPLSCHVFLIASGPFPWWDRIILKPYLPCLTAMGSLRSRVLVAATSQSWVQKRHELLGITLQQDSLFW